MKILEDYAANADRIERLESELKQARQEQKLLAEQVLMYFQEVGASNARAGGRTIYIHRQLWVNADANDPQVYGALVGAGAGRLVTSVIQTSKLTEFWQNLEDQGDTVIIELLRPHVKLSDEPGVRSRKQATKDQD